ncbi:patatin-like phospholipase family protein [Ulvibacterium marinum]|uniref:Patatin n=1 Tax=Ulvibacterium marinum TaxID=2419782 RepID=A0A3B0CB77_9FLAO|nr:patatin-like phospholipase family protein [Ulvibacterium marinum]RKN83083.1 patatin [Ulvibacterium marinum]
MPRPVLIVFTFLFSLLLTAQNSVEDKVKVGVVLSGGGAKGMAHIGALKVIEEAGVKVDYIGGTSMGAIVGGLYAAGYSAMELDSLFRAIDFANLIRDNLPRDAKTFYEKEDSERYAITLPFNNFKVSVPPAYSGGQNIYNELVRLLYHVRDVKDFSKLPIPFLCIATNAETGEEVLLNEGYLPEAVMASGALPSLFEPASVDDRILIDGGVVNNYPIDEVRKMGADIMIGVDVQHGLSDREELLSATEILLQINNFRTVKDMGEKSGMTDIYIKPEMEDFSVIDFDERENIIDEGEIAAREKYVELKELSINQNSSKKTVNSLGLNDKLIVNRLVISGNNDNYSRGYVKGKLRFDLGEELKFEKFQQGISNLSATGNFKTIRYRLTSNGIGEDLILNLDEDPNRTLLRLGAHYDDLYKSAAIINLTKKRLLAKDDLASFDLILGDNVRYNFEYYIDKGTYWSFGINSRFNAFEKEIDYDLISGNFDVPNDPNINSINLDITDVTNQVYVQTVLREEFAFTTGIEHKFLKYSTRTLGNVPTAEALIAVRSSGERTFFEKSNFYSAFGQLTLDTYDDKYFPSKGLFFDGDFHFYVFSSDFNDNFKEFSIAKAKLGGAFSILKNLSLNVESEGGFKLGTSNVTSFDFVLGGFGTDLINNFIPFIGYDFLSLPGNSFVKSYARVDWEFARKNHLMFTANFANVQDDIFRLGEWFTAPSFSGYGISYGWESFLGPVQVMYSWSPEGGTSNVFFSVGHWF